mmetsp:Transcript_43344/g.125295  ORF Transcript_43344/g.125295 Transcript_43344/m.125295 type:complete len:1133 (-) Transcript_43344:146-3544(-)
MRSGTGARDLASDKEADDPLLPAEGGGAKKDPKKEKFIEIALKSPCADSLSEQMLDKTHAKDPKIAEQCKAELNKFKRDLFAGIYDHISQDEKLAADLKSAVVVKNPKFTYSQRLVLGVLTLGFFYILRPKDDDSAVVLTKSGRVLTLKIERDGMFVQNPLGTLITFTRYIILLAVAVTLPSILVFICLTQKTSEEQFGVDDAMKLQLGHALMEKIKRHWILSSEVILIFVAGFVCWVWSKCPSDVGSRYRESYRANSVVAGQLVMRDNKLLMSRSKTFMKLYFGKYPQQAVLDVQGGGSNNNQGGMVKTRSPMSLAATGGTGNGVKDAAALKKPPAPGSASASAPLIVLVSVVTMLDTGLTWLERANTLTEMLKSGEFCRITEDEDKCTRQVCRAWAKEHEHDDAFCVGVEWHDKIHSKTQIATCAYYGYSSPPCCGGCGIGQAMGEVKEGGWLSLLVEILGVIADVGTLAFSVMAASQAIMPPEATDHFDIFINKGVRQEDFTTDYHFTLPSAMSLFDSVFEYTFVDEEGKRKPRGQFEKIVHTGKLVEEGSVVRSWWSSSPTAPQQEQSPQDQGPSPDIEPGKSGEAETIQESGVSNYQLHLDSTSWDQFFDDKNTLTQDAENKGEHKAIVPIKLLGIDNYDQDKEPNPDAERVVAAWAEKPPLLLAADLLVPIAVATLFTSCLLVDRKSLTGDSFELPGLPDTLIGRTASAFGFGALVFFAGIAGKVISGLFNSAEHIVVVTDSRLFYVRCKLPCFWVFNFERYLRVDCFRHDRTVSYGSVSSKHRSLLQRLRGVTWRPGTVVMQNKFGVLELSRMQGNAWNLFNVIQQLAPSESFLSEADCDGGWDFQESAKNAGANIPDFPHDPEAKGVRYIQKQATDFVDHGPCLYMVSPDGKSRETPIYHWSFKQVGALGSTLNTVTDIVVSTSRFFIWKRANWKKYDCRTALRSPFGWLAAMSEVQSVTNDVSFFTLENLLSFSSAVKVRSPNWTDPTHQPVTCPLIDTCCRRITKCCRGEAGDEQDEEDVLQYAESMQSTADYLLPLRTPPRVEMWLLFRLKTCPQQPDLIATVNPFFHKDFVGASEIGDMFTCLEGKDKEKVVPEHYEKVTQLRAIMAVAQDKAQGGSRAK